jgi:hypothetical protein
MTDPKCLNKSPRLPSRTGGWLLILCQRIYLPRRYVAPRKMYGDGDYVAGMFSVQDVSQVVQVESHCQIDGETHVQLRIPRTGWGTHMYHRCPIKSCVTPPIDSCVTPTRFGVPHDVGDDARLRFYRFAGRRELVVHIEEAHGLSSNTWAFNNTYYHVSTKKISATYLEKNIREKFEMRLAQVCKKARMLDRGNVLLRCDVMLMLADVSDSDVNNDEDDDDK